MNIAVSTAHRIYHRFEQTGSVNATPPVSRPDCRNLNEFHELFVIALVIENTCISLQEIYNKNEEATGFHVSQFVGTQEKWLYMKANSNCSTAAISGL